VSDQQRLRVLLVDDEPHDLEQLERIVKFVAKDAEVVATAASGDEALAVSAPFDVAIVDYRMPQMNGIELAEQLKRDHPDCTVVIITAFEDAREEILEHPAVDHYHEKALIYEVEPLLEKIAAERRGEGKKRRGLLRRK